MQPKRNLTFSQGRVSRRGEQDVATQGRQFGTGAGFVHSRRTLLRPARVLRLRRPEALLTAARCRPVDDETAQSKNAQASSKLGKIKRKT